MRRGLLSLGVLCGCLLPAFAQSSPETSTAKAPPSSQSAASNTTTGNAQAPARPLADKARSTALAKGEISFDDLVFDIEKGGKYDASMLTDKIRELNNKKVKLRGFILPSTLFRETNIDEFVLVRDNQECCFGPGAALYDCVVVNLVGGVTTDYTTRAVTVTGTFKLKEYKYPDNSGHFAIFNIQGTDVR